MADRILCRECGHDEFVLYRHVTGGVKSVSCAECDTTHALRPPVVAGTEDQ